MTAIKTAIMIAEFMLFYIIGRLAGFSYVDGE